MIWAVFQPALLTNAMLIEQGLANVIYETQKEASLQGYYDEELYKKIKDRLALIHKFDPSKVEVRGTETLTKRGELMYIEVIIPRPNITVIDTFKFGNDEPYYYKKYIMSEYID